MSGVNSNITREPSQQRNHKHARIQQQNMVFDMQYIDKNSMMPKRETLGPLPFSDLIIAIRIRFEELQKDYPASNTIKNVLDSLSESKMQEINFAMNNTIYCYPLSSLEKSNEHEICPLNHKNNVVLARISETNNIALMLRMHLIDGNNRIFIETTLSVPEWLKDDIRKEMLRLIEMDYTGLLSCSYTRTLQSNHIQRIKTIIATATFDVPTTDTPIKYLYQLQCPTMYMSLHAPTPKIVSPKISGMFLRLPPLNSSIAPTPMPSPQSSPPLPNLSDDFDFTDIFGDLFNTTPPIDDDNSLAYNYLNWPDFEQPNQNHISAVTTQTAPSSRPLIFRQNATSDSTITQDVRKKNRLH